MSLIGSTCIYQGEELGLEDVQDIPIEKMKDPWGIEFAPEFLGRDTCRTPMVWDSLYPIVGFQQQIIPGFLYRGSTLKGLL